MARNSLIAGAAARIGRFLYGIANGFGSGGGGYYRRALPQAEVDYAAEVGEAFRSTPVAICLAFLGRQAVKPDLVVTRERGKGKGGQVANHPLVRLLDRPNPYYSYADLIKFTVLQGSTGNAYWIKVRNALGGVVQLVPVPSYTMLPISYDPAQLITHYQYTAAGVIRTYPRADVVHFRDGIDPDDPRLGLSEFGYLARELYSDNALATMKAALCRNLGVPGLIFSAADPEHPVPDRDIEVIREQLIEKTTGENRGQPLGLQGGWRVDKLGWSLKDMDVGRWQGESAERICAAAGLNAMAVNLPSASKTHSNYAEAIRSAWEEGVLPRLEGIAETLYHQLLPDLGDPDRERVEFDTSRVPSLAESQESIVARNLQSLGGGGMMRSEYRAAVGLPVTAADEVYYLPRGVVVVSGDNFPIASLPDLNAAGPGGADPGDDAADPAGEEALDDAPPEDAPDVAESTQDQQKG